MYEEIFNKLLFSNKLLDKTRTIKSLTAIQKWGIFIKELNVK